MACSPGTTYIGECGTQTNVCTSVVCEQGSSYYYTYHMDLYYDRCRDNVTGAITCQYRDAGNKTCTCWKGPGS